MISIDVSIYVLGFILGATSMLCSFVLLDAWGSRKKQDKKQYHISKIDLEAFEHPRVIKLKE